MKFDGLYKHIIESFNDSKLVALDGGREVYICNVYVEEYYNTKTLDSITITPVHRMPEENLMYWDTETGRKWDMFIRKFDSLEKALENVATEYLMGHNLSHGGTYDVGHEYYFEPQAAELIKDKLREALKPYLHLPGEWGYCAFGEHDILEFGIEIDINTYRMGGIRDSVKTTVDSEEDISDW
jgi:hypothetical protein